MSHQIAMCAPCCDSTELCPRLSGQFVLDRPPRPSCGKEEHLPLSYKVTFAVLAAQLALPSFSLWELLGEEEKGHEPG